MAIYKTSELLKQICEIINDGYEYVDIEEYEADDEFPASLHFDAQGEFEAVDYAEVESCDIPDDYNFNRHDVSLNLQDPCGYITFTHSEIFVIEQAVRNALAYMKEESTKNSQYSKDTIADMKRSMIDLRNLQAKLAKCLKRYHFQ